MIAALPPAIPVETVGFYTLMTQFLAVVSDPANAKARADELINKMQACEAVRAEAQKLVDTAQAAQLDIDKRVEDVKKQTDELVESWLKFDAAQSDILKKNEALNIREVALNNKEAKFAARENGITEREKKVTEREKNLDEASTQLEKLRAEWQGKIDKLKSLAA